MCVLLFNLGNVKSHKPESVLLVVVWASSYGLSVGVVFALPNQSFFFCPCQRRGWVLHCLLLSNCQACILYCFGLKQYFVRIWSLADKDCSWIVWARCSIRVCQRISHLWLDWMISGIEMISGIASFHRCSIWFTWIFQIQVCWMILEYLSYGLLHQNLCRFVLMLGFQTGLCWELQWRNHTRFISNPLP